MRATIVLFDVDGTLVHTGGAGRRAMAAGFDAVCGRGDAIGAIRLGGMTDRLIVRTGLEAIGHAVGDSVIDEILAAYLELLPDEVARSEGYRILPGVHEAVQACSARAGFAVGLGTGNVERGARLKLARGGLADAFTFGGYGCDAEDRVELLGAGIRRGAERLGEPADRCRIVIVGDTPRDVAAACSLGAECVAVGTGGYAPDELLGLGAAAAFGDLTEARVLDALLG